MQINSEVVVKIKIPPSAPYFACVAAAALIMAQSPSLQSVQICTFFRLSHSFTNALLKVSPI